MRPFRSIRWRLQLWYGGLFAVVLTGLGLTAYYLERADRYGRIDGELQRMAILVQGAFRPGPLEAREGRSPLPPPGPPGAPGNRRPGPPAGAPPRPNIDEVISAEHTARGFYYAVWRRNGPRYTASANVPADLPAPAPNVMGMRQRGVYREAVFMANPGDYALVGRSIAGEFAELHRFGWMLAGGGLAIFAVTVIIGGWLVTRALQPIQDIGATATKIATGDLTQRIDTHDTDSELGQLAAVLNATFSRLETAFTQQARFTADAAHELRTPVTVMLTHVQNALAVEGASEEHREAFEACQRAAQRMRRMIESLLQLARLEAGQESLNYASVDLAALLTGEVEQLRPLAAERGITIQIDASATMARGDADRLSQVIMNLLANAVHHNKPSGKIFVRTRQEAGLAIMEVADHGPGVASEHRSHIFDRFYRADKARTSTSGRTGLGLAISKALVEAHSGTIGVTETAGGGATFTVRLPAA